jgi:hypothetical protein
MSHYLSIAAVFKQETKYLREWLEYHLLLGVNHFYLYLHDQEPEITKVVNILSNYSPKLITPVLWYHYNEGDFQIKAYADALKSFGHLTRWLAFIDLDEFIFPVSRASIDQVLQDYDSDSISGLNVSVCTFGDSERDTSPTLQTRDLIWRAYDQKPCNLTSKQFFRPEKIKEYKYGGCWDRCLNLDYKVSHSCKQSRPLSPLRVNHYPVRSEIDWKEKVKRDWPKGIVLHDLSSADWARKYQMLNNNDIEDTSMWRFTKELEKRLLM